MDHFRSDRQTVFTYGCRELGSISTAEMPFNCSVYGCAANSDKCRGLSFHSFPKNNELRREWLVKLRHGKVPSQYARVCSRHFNEDDYISPLLPNGGFKNRHLKTNAVPSQNLPTSSHPSRSAGVSFDRSLRLVERKKRIHNRNADLSPNCDDSDSVANSLSTNCLSDGENYALHSEGSSLVEGNNIFTSEAHGVSRERIECGEPPSSTTTVPQCSHNILKSNHQLFSVCLFSEKQMVAFTGFTRQQFECLWQFVVSSEEFEPCRQTVVNSRDQLLLTLIKLRSNQTFQFLGYCFNINEHFVSSIFSKWVNAIYRAFKEVDFCSMYEKKEGEYDMVIDCSEIPIRNSSCPDIAQTTYSTYKSGHTFKVLVGCSESGAALYCSDLYGGSISDRHIVQSCGFLDLVKEGQFILADKGFLIGDLLESKGAQLNIPPFRESRHVQMTPLQVATTKVIANRRIVIEQIIGKAKNYAIITDVMPSYVWPLANKIFYIVFFFNNFKKKAI